MAWVGKKEQDLKKDGVKYEVGRFQFFANSRATTNLDTGGQVKFLVEEETDLILGVHIIGALPKLPSGIILSYLRSYCWRDDRRG